MKFNVYAPINYISGHIRYGHVEGVVEVESEEEIKKLIESEDIRDFLDLVVDDYYVSDIGDIGDYEYEVIE